MSKLTVREKALREAKMKMREATSGEEVKNAMKAYFEKYASPAPKKDPYEEILKVFDGKVDTTVKGPLFS